MANKITKANGHIVQSDWAQTDETKMDYIHNKPENLTTVTVDGEPVEVFDADTKVSKLGKSGDGSWKVYISKPDSTVAGFKVQTSINTSKVDCIPRFLNGNFPDGDVIVEGYLTTNTPKKSTHCANKKYVDTVANNLSFSTDLTETTISLDMTSNTEYHCTNPVESLTINSFTAGTSGIADQWSVIFTAGTTISVTHPDTVKWALATPIFDPNKIYWLSFIPFGSYYLGTWTVVE